MKMMEMKMAENGELKAELRRELKKRLAGSEMVPFEEGMDRATALMYLLGIINDPQDHKYIMIKRVHFDEPRRDTIELEVGFERFFLLPLEEGEEETEVGEEDFWAEVKRRHGGPLHNWAALEHYGYYTHEADWFQF